MFPTAEAAAEAYDESALQMLGRKARTNFLWRTSIAEEDCKQLLLSNMGIAKEEEEELAAAVVTSHHSPKPIVVGSMPPVPSTGLGGKREYRGVGMGRKRPRVTSASPPVPLAALISSHSTPTHSSKGSSAVDASREGADFRSESPLPNWREQIYYWTGSFTFDGRSGRLRWTGRWLGSFSGRPTVDEFLAASQTFDYFSEVKLDREEIIKDGLLRPPSHLSFNGYFNMQSDVSTSLEHFEERFSLTLRPEENVIDENKLVAAGSGESEFGAFVMSGVYILGAESLDLSRKYIITGPYEEQFIETF